MSTPDPNAPWPKVTTLHEPWPVLHGPDLECFCGMALPWALAETVPSLPHLGYAHPTCCPIHEDP